MGDGGFNLSTVFGTLAKTLPGHRALIWRGREWTYAEMDARIDGNAHYLASLGLGCHTERDQEGCCRKPLDHSGIR
jgi:non-ribosomal peptide synthetase component E (peptide arylation enzyme)